MIYPSIDKILNIVDSKYALVYVVAERAKQMKKTGYYQLPIKEYKCQKEIGRALEEVYDNLIKVMSLFEKAHYSYKKTLQRKNFIVKYS